jgi:hypothetical protein
MDKQGQPKKIQTLGIVFVLAATLASPLMIISNVFDISLAYATTTAADAQDDKINKASIQLADEPWNNQQNEQPDCYAFCTNIQNRTR